MESRKKGTLKDWIEVLVLITIIISVCLYLCSLYNNYKKESMNNFVLEDTVKQIKYEEIKPYLQENNDVYLYICVNDDNDCREFEESIKEKIRIKDLGEYIVYLNLKDYPNKKEIIDDLNDNYASKKKIDYYPAFVRIKNQKIVSMVEKINKKLTKSNFEKFIEVNEIS